MANMLTWRLTGHSWFQLSRWQENQFTFPRHCIFTSPLALEKARNNQIGSTSSVVFWLSHPISAVIKGLYETMGGIHSPSWPRGLLADRMLMLVPHADDKFNGAGYLLLQRKSAGSKANCFPCDDPDQALRFRRE